MRAALQARGAGHARHHASKSLSAGAESHPARLCAWMAIQYLRWLSGLSEATAAVSLSALGAEIGSLDESQASPFGELQEQTPLCGRPKLELHVDQLLSDVAAEALKDQVVVAGRKQVEVCVGPDPQADHTLTLVSIATEPQRSQR